MKSFPSLTPSPRLNVFKIAAGRMALVVALALACGTAAQADAIHDAARKGDLKKTLALIQADPTVVKSKDNLGDTPLHVAALHGNVEVAKALIEAGADVNAKNSYPPFLPADLGAFLSSNNHQDPAVLLTVHGNDAKDLQNGYTPLDLAAFSVRYKPMVELLVAKGADVNAQAASGATPAFWAVLREQKDELVFLLAHGANVNAADAYGDTLLDMALHLQYFTMIPILLDKGADVNAIDQSQHRPLTYALQMDDHKWADMLRKKGAHE
jgi:ankyrin repeat protein